MNDTLYTMFASDKFFLLWHIVLFLVGVLLFVFITNSNELMRFSQQEILDEKIIASSNMMHVSKA